ncbi:MAG: Xaa-Pro peptidase family protein [Chloroflexota bacterium]|nr:Xaa-Pro peptidase family protein [Chloroflexota bacterium]
MPIVPVESILTLEERDRRWKNIRDEMKRRDLACLVVWGSQGYWTGLAANIRYLANILDEGYLVFPLEGEPTLFTFEIGLPSPWLKDHRAGQPRYSAAVAKRLRELCLERARIGIVGLSGYLGEMGFPYATYMALVNAFPSAKFEDTTDILEKARLVKSAAEIRCFELGCEVGLRGMQAIALTARPGVKDYEVKAALMDTVYRNGCEPGFMLLYVSGKEGVHGGRGGRHRPPDLKALEPGDVILLEFDARYFGYFAQFNQSFAIGQPAEDWSNIFDVSVKSFYSGLKVLKPGITLGELDEAFLTPIREAGYNVRNPAFHGLGLYLEMPMGSYPGQPEYKPDNSFVIKENMVLEFEPHVESRDGKKAIHMGSPVLVTENGGRLLTPGWKPEFIIC